MTFHLDLELEHTLDAGSSGDHCVQVWWQSDHLSGRKGDLRNKFTDRQTDDKRRAIALAHWNEINWLFRSDEISFSPSFPLHSKVGDK